MKVRLKIKVKDIPANTELNVIEFDGIQYFKVEYMNGSEKIVTNISILVYKEFCEIIP